jgi:arylsulfatase A-like enzyme
VTRPLALGLLALAWLACAPDDTRPSIVLVVVDTLRADAVSAYGVVEGTTPGMDLLAAEGLRYARAYAPSSWTIPSHASLFTGLGVERHGTGLAGQSSLPERLVTVAERLSEAGYQTAAFAENMIVSDAFQLLQGFAYRRTNRLHRKGVNDAPLDHYVTIDLEQQIQSWLGRRDPSRPFFVFVNVYDAHSPYEVRDENPWVPAGASPSELGRFAAKPEDHLCSKLPSKRDRELLRGLYLGDVFAADAEVKAFLAKLSDAETTRDLITVITSDHGEFFGEGQLMGHEFGLRHGGLHIPLIVHGLPGIEPGSIETPVSLVDVSASVLAWAGIDPPAGLSGTPLPTSSRPPGEASRALRSAYSDSLTIIPEAWGDRLVPVDRETPRVACGPEHKVFGGMASLIDYPYKFNWFERYPPELYDLRWDTDEESDLAAHQPEQVARLTRDLADFVAAVGFGGEERQPEELPSLEAVEALRALGYIDE